MGIRPRLLLKNKVFIRWEFLSPFCKRSLEVDRVVLKLEGLEASERSREAGTGAGFSHAEAGLSLSSSKVTRGCLHSELAKTLLTQEVSAAQKFISVLSTFKPTAVLGVSFL